MKKYFGIFEDVAINYPETYSEQEFYYSDTVNMYDEMSVTYNDFPLFYDMAKLYGGPVLDICCGSGRITLAMAKKGLEITGVDLSNDMLNQFSCLIDTKYKRLKNKITLLNQDMTKLNLPHKYNLIIIGATSIRLLPGSFTEFFNQIYDNLNDGGCFCFNFEEIKSIVGKKENIEDLIATSIKDNNGRLCLIMLQRLINYSEKKAVVNFMKMIPRTTEKILLSMTEYRIFDKNEIEDAIKNSKFKDYEFIECSNSEYFCKLNK